MPSSFGKSLDLWRPPASPMGAVARLVDLVVAAAGLVFFALLKIFVAAAIFVAAGQPIFFQHKAGHRL